jgi:hypothetical protein
MALCASKRVIACLKQLTHQELQFTDAIPDSPSLHVHPVRNVTRNFLCTIGAFLASKPEIEATRTVSITDHSIFPEIIWSPRICPPLGRGVTFVSTGERPAKHENAQDVPVRCVFPGI